MCKVVCNNSRQSLPLGLSWWPSDQSVCWWCQKFEERIPEGAHPEESFRIRHALWINKQKWSSFSNQCHSHLRSWVVLLTLPGGFWTLSLSVRQIDSDFVAVHNPRPVLFNVLGYKKDFTEIFMGKTRKKVVHLKYVLTAIIPSATSKACLGAFKPMSADPSGIFGASSFSESSLSPTRRRFLSLPSSSSLSRSLQHTASHLLLVTDQNKVSNWV